MNLLALVRRNVFEKELREHGCPDQVGGLLPWRNWTGNNSELAMLGDGGVLWAVTVRPAGTLWLVACYRPATVTEHKNERPRFEIQAPSNKVRITNITSIAKSLRFSNRKGVDTRPDVMPHSLQMVGVLTKDSIALLERAVGGKQKVVAKQPDEELSAVEGEVVSELVRRRTRDAKLRIARLVLDEFMCTACGFSAPAALGESSFVVEVHHVNPLSDAREVTTNRSDLLTLCPTCHRLIHALAKVEKRTKGLNLKFLQSATG